MPARYTAVLDRIVDGKTAVLLLEEDGSVTAERTVPLEELPEGSRHEGAVLEIKADMTDDSIVDATYQAEDERERRERAQDRFDDLSERLSDE